jgi:hypothetical protein
MMGTSAWALSSEYDPKRREHMNFEFIHGTMMKAQQSITMDRPRCQLKTFYSLPVSYWSDPSTCAVVDRW